MALVRVIAIVNTSAKDIVLTFPNGNQQFYDADSSLAEAVVDAIEDAMSECPVKGCTAKDCEH